MKATAAPTSTNRTMRPKVATRGGILMKRADVRRAEAQPVAAASRRARFQLPKQANTSVRLGSVSSVAASCW